MNTLEGNPVQLDREVGRQRTENEKTEVSLRPIGAYAPVGGRRSEVRDRMTEKQRSEIGGQRSEDISIEKA